MRIALALLGALAVVAAVMFVVTAEQSIAARRTTVGAFDLHAREAEDTLAELRIAQQAYVAAGQGLDFWTSKVDSTTRTIAGALTSLQQTATTAASKAALEDAAAAMAEFANVDRRIRGYLKSDSQLMAADVVFTEGGETTAGAARAIEKARVEERVTSDRAEAALRKREAMAAGGAGAFLMLALVILAVMPAAANAIPDAVVQTRPSETPVAVVAPSHADELVLRRDDRPDHRAPEPATAAAPRPTESPRRAAALKAAAELCTDIGRVSDLEELQSLLGRAADVLEASGLVLWLASESGTELRPAVAHGYSQETLVRIPALARSADNAAAAAYRTGSLQIVLSRPGSPAKGAIVAPLLSTEGCIGVLAAEVRDGAEASDSTQALAAILAAQLGGVVASPVVQSDQRASGGAAI